MRALCARANNSLRKVLRVPGRGKRAAFAICAGEPGEGEFRLNERRGLRYSYGTHFVLLQSSLGLRLVLREEAPAGDDGDKQRPGTGNDVAHFYFTTLYAAEGRRRRTPLVPSVC